MATLTAPSRRPEEDEDSVGQRHFDDVVGGARSPEDLDTQDSPDEEAAIKRMRDQEQGGGGSKDDRGVSDREGEPERFTFRNGQEAYDRSKKHTEEAQQRGQRKRRGLFIGIGAGGGIISIFAGMMTLLPFKMPALMDFVTDFAGERVEDVLLHESEKIMLRFFLRGSNAAIANGDVIVTGNPIGDLFANMRISRFKDRVLKPRGITIEPNGNGGIRIFHDGTSLGDFKEEAKLREFFGRTDLTYRDSKKFFRQLVKEDIPWYRWVKRMKVAKLLRLKYVPFLGVGQRKPDETNEEWAKRVKQLEADQISSGNAERASKLMECVSKPDCEALDPDAQEEMDSRTGSADGAKAGDIAETAVKEAGEEIVEHIAEDVAQEGIETIAKQGSSKLATLVGAGAATGGILAIVDLVTMAANLDHLASNAVNNGKFIKTIAALRAAAYGTFYGFMAGVSDQGKAGELDSFGMGLFADQFNHVAEAAPYNVMNANKLEGEDVENFRKPNGNIAGNTWIQLYDQIYNGPLIALRAPLIAWYYTIGWLWNHIGEAVGNGVVWVFEHTPCAAFISVVCPSQLMQEMGALIAPLWNWLTMFLGFAVDAFESSPLAFAYLAYGAQTAMDEYGKTVDFHELSATSAQESARRIAREKAEYNSDRPFFDRMFSLDNTASLASALVRTMPTLNPMNGGVGRLAFAGASIASSLPGNLADLASSPAHADDPQITLNQMMNQPEIGIDENEREFDIAPTLMSGGTCTVNNDAHYDPCAAQQTVIDGINCDISVVSLCPDGGPPTGDNSNINPATALPEGQSSQLAKMILDNPNITFEGNAPNYPGDGAHHDFMVMADGEGTRITACGTPIRISTKLMQVILAAAGNYTDASGRQVPSRYKFRINALLSDHDCNGGFHPKGQAVDLGWVNGVYAGPDGGCPGNGCGLGTDLYKTFATFIGSNLPSTGRIGQTQCLGHLDIPASIIQHRDTCHHLHVATGQ